MNTYKITSENKTRELGTVTAKDAISALEMYCQTAGIKTYKDNGVGILVDHATRGATWASVLTISDGRISADRVTPATDDQRCADLDVINAMESYGGSFVQALASAARHADSVNLDKIKRTWPELWSRYDENARGAK